MLPFSFLTIFASFIIYRLLILLTLRTFGPSVLVSPLRNLACGLLSDLMVTAILGLVWYSLLLFARWSAARSSALRLLVPNLASAITGLMALALVVTMATHMRYVEHFGMNLRPFHVVALDTGEVWDVGFKMVLASWRSDLLLVLPWILAALFSKNFSRRLTTLQIRPAKDQAKISIILIVAIATLNTSVIGLRYLAGVNAELRYNPLIALFYNAYEEQRIEALPLPSIEKRRALHAMMPGTRHFTTDPTLSEYVLWQTEISNNTNATGDRAETGRRFAAYLRDEEAKHGPWNVVLVLSESLRANELEAFGSSDPLAPGLTPGLTALADEGVIFTEMINGGLRTHYGQMMASCSLYGVFDFGLLNKAPMSNTVCASDIFSGKGYETFFFYGANNHFDSQEDFYRHHQVTHVFDENDFPKETTKGGWGYSDHAVFDFTLDRLSAAQKPFFAIVLTLSNHFPHKIPGDVPKGIIRKDIPIRHQLIQYVDWSTADFYKKLAEKMPHTLFVMLADHGLPWEEPPSMAKPKYEPLRQIARIPFLILAPGLPSTVKGKKFGDLTSNVDVTPTILALLGMDKTPQQFMGQNAFTREGPVFIDWQQTLLKISEPDTATGQKPCCDIRILSEELDKTLGGILRYNVLAPPKT